MKKLQEDRQKEKRKKINWVYIVLGIMIVVQLGTLIYSFQFKKEGCHSDELWSYGYANSYYQKDIYQNEKSEPINCNEWVSGDVLRDYLVVNEGEQFKYASVYQNQINDLSPPLHSMLLHTICSFFPERFSLWFSFSINIVAFIVSMIFLFKTAKLLKNDIFALCCCVLYGFSLGARDTFIYLRMYALCTAFFMVITYHLLLYLDKSKKNRKAYNIHLAIVAVVSFLAFLTHYYMIAVMGIMTFLICIMLLFQKRIKVMFTYGLSMLGTFLLSIGAFPSLLRVTDNQVGQIASETEKMLNYTFPIRFKFIAHYFTYKEFNFSVSIYKNAMVPIVFGCIVFGCIVMLPIVYLFRETAFVMKITQKVKMIFKHPVSIMRYLLRRINWIYPIFFIIMVLQIIVVGETTSVYGMGNYVDRYIMYLYPLEVIVGIAAVYQIGLILFKRKKISRWIIVAAVLVLCVLNLYNRAYDTSYCFPEETTGKAIEECVEDKDCIYFTTNFWMLTAMTSKLMDADEFFMVWINGYKEYEEAYLEKLADGPVVLVFDTSFKNGLSNKLAYEDVGYSDEVEEEMAQIENAYQQRLQYFEDLVPDTTMKKLTTETVYSRPVEVYLINP